MDEETKKLFQELRELVTSGHSLSPRAMDIRKILHNKMGQAIEEYKKTLDNEESSK